MGKPWVALEFESTHATSNHSLCLYGLAVPSPPNIVFSTIEKLRQLINKLFH